MVQTTNQISLKSHLLLDEIGSVHDVAQLWHRSLTQRGFCVRLIQSRRESQSVGTPEWLSYHGDEPVDLGALPFPQTRLQLRTKTTSNSFVQDLFVSVNGGYPKMDGL